MIRGTLSADASFSTRWRSSTPNTLGGGRSLRRGYGVTNCSRRVNFTYSKPRGSRRTHSCWLREAAGARDRERKDKEIRAKHKKDAGWEGYCAMVEICQCYKIYYIMGSSLVKSTKFQKLHWLHFLISFILSVFFINSDESLNVKHHGWIFTEECTIL